MSPSSLAAAIAACALALLLAAGWFLTRPSEPLPVAAEGRNLDELVPGPRSDTTFITSQGCRECHPDQYASWHKSYHRTMTQRATPQTVLADFDDQVLELRGEVFRLSRSGDEFWVDRPAAHDLDAAKADTPLEPGARIKRQVVMTTGSHRFQVYWTATGVGNQLKSIPFVYLTADERMVPIEDAVLAPSSPNGDNIWNHRCIHCHSVGPMPNVSADESTSHSQIAELGISCERCHGPGEAHAAKHRAAAKAPSDQRTSERADDTIVLPTRLDHQAASQVCAQCHSLHTWKDPWEQFRLTGYRYRPGQELTLDHDVVRPLAQITDERERKVHETFFEGQTGGERSEFWDDGTPRVSGREYNSLLETACFTRGALGCTSCHSMHQSDPSSQLAAEMQGNQACYQCHNEYRERLAEHTHHPAESSGSLCYNCHMPRTTYGLLSFTRSHRIDSPRATGRTGAEHPNACVLCHLDQTSTWAGKFLTDWYGQPAPEVKEPETESAAVLLALRGDCCERALFAWHARWEPARAVSGSAWLAPWVIQLLDDPYPAVRYQAAHTLRTLPGFESFVYDYLAPASVRALRRQQADELWSRQSSAAADRRGPRVLLEDDGTIMRQRAQQILERRDHRPMRCLN